MVEKMKLDLGKLLSFCRGYGIKIESESGYFGGKYFTFTKDDIKRKLYVANTPALAETDDKDILEELMFWCDYMIVSKTNELRKNVKELVIGIVNNEEALDTLVDILINDDKFIQAVKEVAEQ